MRTATLTLCVLLSSAMVFAAPPAPAQQDEQDVMAAMHAWIQAVTSQDVATLQKLFHDGLIYTHSDARTQTKAEVIEDVRAGRGSASIELADTVVRVYGTTALVKVRATIRGRPQPGQTPSAAAPAPTIVSVMHVLLKGPQGWQLVSRQATRFPAAPTPAH